MTWWICTSCIPGCRLQGGDPDNPPEGCPWHYNNTDDPDLSEWRQVD